MKIWCATDEKLDTWANGKQKKIPCSDFVYDEIGTNPSP
jgi:hypothetical protein